VQWTRRLRVCLHSAVRGGAPLTSDLGPYMIAGNPSRFAVESGITEAYERLSFLALGFFNVHIEGRRYGVHATDATLLACSFDEIEERIAERGIHTAPLQRNPMLARSQTPIAMPFTPLTKRKNRLLEFHTLSFANLFPQVISCGHLTAIKPLMTGVTCFNSMLGSAFA